MIKAHIFLRRLRPAEVLQHIVLPQGIESIGRIIVKSQSSVDGRKEIVGVVALEGKSAALAACVKHVKTLVLCGATADKIRAAVEKAEGYAPGKPEIVIAANLTEAVEAAREKGAEGDVVTLSPACASFDQFRNFAERGKAFKAIVNSWK